MEEAEAIRRVAGALLTGGGAIGVGIGVGLITAKSSKELQDSLNFNLTSLHSY